MSHDLVLRGRREVSALVLHGPDAPARALAWWVTGSHVQRLDNGAVLLRFPHAVPLDCDRVPGIPLVRHGGQLVALPPGDGLPAGDVVLAEGGRLVGRRAGEPLSPAGLVELTGWRVVRRPPAGPGVQVTPTGPPPPVEAAPPAEPLDLRDELTGLDPPSPRTRRRQRRLLGGDGDGRPSRPAAPPARSRGAGGPAAAGRPARTGPTWLDRIRARRHDTARQRRAHAAYVRELQALFERGEIDEALRRAIPMGGDGRLRSFALPTPRTDLRIEPYRGPGTGSAAVAADVQAELRRQYRAVFDQLDREGRVRDAAFVLAELLDATEEACSYLERHRELTLAARLAEARTADPALVVRLWWLAGDRERAVVIARRHSCFGPAVSRLERVGDHDTANSLRRRWAAHLLAAGDLVDAVDVLVPVDDEASRAIRGQAIAAGMDRPGPVRARLLARQLRAGEPEPAAALDRLVAPDGDPDERALLADELVRVRTPLDHPYAVRPLCRALLVDGYDAKRLDRLVSLCADTVLKADLPPAPPRRDPRPVQLDVAPDDRGLVPVLDARALAQGEVALALGGHGVQVLRRDGRPVATFDVPADHLVPADNGSSLLALRRVGPRVVTVWVIDLATRRHRMYGEIAADLWAGSFDGAQWFVAHGDGVLMLDLLAGGPATIWRVTEAPGQIVGLARSPAALSSSAFLGMDGDGRWKVAVTTYELPRFVVRSRREALVPEGWNLVADGTHHAAAVDSGRDVVVTAVPGLRGPNDEPGPEPSVVVTARRDPLVQIRLAGVDRCAAHLDGSVLITGDALGRVERYALDHDRREPAIRTGV